MELFFFYIFFIISVPLWFFIVISLPVMLITLFLCPYIHGKISQIPSTYRLKNRKEQKRNLLPREGFGIDETEPGGTDQNESLIQAQLALQLKEQDLMYHAMVLTELKQVQKSIGNRLSPFQFRFLKKKDQEEFQQLLSEIVRDTSHEPMQDFEIMFKQMHGGFYEKLLNCCSDLTRSELQICALLRLNLSSKDMARLTNLSVSSIDITRHRIRKKLGVDPQASLTGFLIQFS